MSKWQPIENYFKEPRQYDWVLVQFEERDTGYRGIPHIAEYRYYPKNSERKEGWYILDMDINDVYKGHYEHFNEVCKAVAFMPIEECKL